MQFRSVDNAGNVSAWTPAVNGATNTGTDRPQRAERADGDGWQRCDELLPEEDGDRVGQQRRGRVGAGALPVPGVAGQRRDVGRDDVGVIGASSATRGVYLVQFQAVDNIGLLSAWAPATPVTANTVCIR